MKMRFYLLLGLVLFIIIIPLSLAESSFSWSSVTPEKVGMDSSGISKIINFLQTQPVHAHSIIMMRDGKLVTEGYFYPYHRSTLLDIHSCTKSVTSILTGIALDQGYLKSVDQELGEFFPELKTSDPRKAKITIRQLLTMSSGLDYTHGKTNDEMENSPDWIKFVLTRPLHDEPGTKFNYSDCNIHLLAAILQKATGQSLADYAKKNLFEPLGITNFIWPADPQGIQHGYADLNINSLDMAKIGYLYLNDGRWNGQQIVSSAWVKVSTRPQIYPNDKGYGYLWWMEHDDGFSAEGSGGQKIIIYPKSKVVVVLTYGLDDKDKDDYLPKDAWQLCFKAENAIPNNPIAYQKLQKLLAKIEESPTSKVSTSSFASKVMDKEYHFNNPSGLNSLKLVPVDAKTIKIQLLVGNQLLELPVGLDNRFLEVKNSQFFYGETVFVKGYWQNPRSFKIILEMGERRVLTCDFNQTGSEVNLTLTERGLFDYKNLKGVAN